MHPPSAAAWPHNTRMQNQEHSRSSAPAQEFQCHYTDCRRTFARKTSLTNHLKAHQNVRSRSIYRTKRARMRAAAAMEQAAAAAAAAAAAGSTSSDPNVNITVIPQQQQAIPSEHTINLRHARSNQTPVTTPSDIHPSSTQNSQQEQQASIQLPSRTETSPVSAESTSSPPRDAQELVAASAAHENPLQLEPSASPGAAMLGEMPASLVSPNSYSTNQLENADTMLFAKSFDMTPTWGMPAPVTGESYEAALLSASIAARSEQDPNVKQEHAQEGGPSLEFLPGTETVQTPGELLGTGGELFPEQMDTLHNYEFLGDFSYN